MSVNESASVKLKLAADEAHALFPNSCSHSVWHVIKAFVPNQPYMTANTLIDHLAGQSQWKVVRPVEVGNLAREGKLVVGGLKEDGNGHVIVVYPGADKPAGGYSYSRGGQTQTMRTRGMYPRAMSTSLGGWAGAKSNGDKTIWDPWANDAKFANVKFWVLEQ